MGIPIGWTDIDCDEPQEHPGWDEDPAEMWPTPVGMDHRKPNNMETIKRKANGGTPYGLELRDAVELKLGGSDLNIPRLTTVKKHRVNRLKACGNGVVPQQAALALRLLLGG